MTAAATTARFALHGFTGRADAWDAVRGPGGPWTGLSIVGHDPALPVPDGWTFDREVDRLLGELPAEPVHLAGYSLGGRLALAMALRAPVRIARLTIVSAQPGLEAEPAAARRAADERWCAILEREGIEAFAAAWEDQPLWASQGRLPDAVRAAQRRTRLSHDPRELARALRVLGTGAMPDHWPRLPALAKVPSDWIAGALDPPYAEIARRAAAAAGGTVHVVDDAGHNVLVERPDQIWRALVGARDERRAP